MERSKAEAVIEAILFTMGDSVEISRLAEVIEEDVKTTKSILKDMAARYEEENRGIGLTQFDNSVQLCTKSDMYRIPDQDRQDSPKDDIDGYGSGDPVHHCL